MKRTYGDEDADLAWLAARTIAAVGFGTQGMAQALNMRDSGLRVIVSETPGSEAWRRAEAEGFSVFPFDEVAERADVFNLQIPDMAFRLADVYNRHIKPRHKAGDVICLSSGFNYYYGHLVPPPGVDAVLVAPKGPGAAVRQEFLNGWGVPGLLAVHQDASGHAHAIGLAICKAVGFTRAGVQDTSVEEEVVTDLLGEHCAWGAIVALLRACFEVMVEAGYDPETAFYEAINESKLTTDLIYQYGLAGMLERISNTAAYGALTIGPKIIDERVKDNIRWALDNIQNGGFSQDWEEDYHNGYPKFTRLLEELRNSQADQVGTQIRRRCSAGEKSEFAAKNL